MKSFNPLSTSDQLAKHLRNEILSGRLSGTMPGISQIVRTLGVNSAATAQALKELEHEGLIISQGRRRKRLIAPTTHLAKSSLRIGFLHYDAQNELRHDSLLTRQALINAGHTPVMAPKTMYDLEMKTERITRMVAATEADAWVVFAGPKETLDWFASQDKPAFAIYGRLNSCALPSIGVKKLHVDEMVLERLIKLGHRRIVLFVREERRVPHYGQIEQRLLELIESHGIQTGPYNIPAWEETAEGLKQGLDRLLEHTPPTAMMVTDPVLLHAVQVHLAHRGYRAPDQVSLYCNDYFESFDWATPSIAHLRWDHRPIVRRVLQWAKNLVQGREDTKKSFTVAKFVDGGTIGPPPSSN